MTPMKPMRHLIALMAFAFMFSSCGAAPPATQPLPKNAQKECLSETDPTSPRHTKLKSDKPDDEIVRWSVENDGHPDVLERWWMGKRCRWIDENHDMKPTDVRGDLSGDSLQVDCDGDGYYDGPGDMNVKWVDDDGDGRADAEIVTINPSASQRSIHGGSAHYMIYVDVDHDGVNAYIDWMTFNWTKADDGNWRTTGKGNYSPDYNGDSIFLKQHLPAWASSNPRMSWENPFAFFDGMHNGCTHMAVRLLDSAEGAVEGSTENKVAGENPPAGTKPTTMMNYQGKDNQGFVTYDLDGDAQQGNEFDFDMSLKFMSSDPKHPGEKLDYSKYSDKHKIRAPQWVLDAHLYRYDNYRRIDDWCYVTHDHCYDELFKVKWGECWFVFDEDDDDHRWERVELYDPDGDPYSLKRERERGKPGLSSNTQADSLGDRGEWDRDNSGHGKLYIGQWDQKIHLLGAERGAWTVDYGGKYWGGSPVQVGGSSKIDAPHVGEVVQYRDTDNNGFIDEITYDYTGNQHIDLKINLLDYKDAQHPHPDEQAVLDPAVLKWPGMHEMYTKISEDSFQQALQLYRAAWRVGLTNRELDDLAIASSTGEKYDHGYWLKEKIFRICDQKLAADSAAQAGLRKAYFLGEYPRVVQIISEIPGVHDDIVVPPQPTTNPTGDSK